MADLSPRKIGRGGQVTPEEVERMIALHAEGVPGRRIAFEVRRSGQPLTIHHIDYDKRNCDDGNLITLCHSCNPRANSNRDQWKAVFTRMLEERRAA